VPVAMGVPTSASASSCSWHSGSSPRCCFVFLAGTFNTVVNKCAAVHSIPSSVTLCKCKDAHPLDAQEAGLCMGVRVRVSVSDPPMRPLYAPTPSMQQAGNRS
jgi:hypothetical protein